MCGLFNDALPVIGAIAGSFLLPGLGTGMGAMIGGAVGGAAGGYLNTHSLGGTLLGGVTGGAGGYFGGGGGGLSSLFSTGTSSALGDLSATAGANAAGSLGELEAGAGGAAMFGPTAGTGTALGGASSALSGQGLGIAGGDALSGVTGNPEFLGGLGGGYGGTGLGVGTNLGASQSALTGAPTASTAATPASNSPTSVMSNTNLNGPTPTTNTANMASGETSQAPSPMGNPLGGQPAQAAGNTVEGSQAAAQGSDVGAALNGGGVPNQGSNLSTMYGPNSTATGSPTGQGIGATGAGFNNVQAGALGEAAKTGMDASDLTGMFNNAAPWMRLANAGYGAYQNYQQQQAQKAYMDQINNMFSPNSPYAQQMQETLARQDAAAGRNSQYGTRAVQLAAALTQARANALGGSNYYHAASQPGGLATMFNPLFANFSSPQGMQQLGQLGSSAFNGLQSLFS